MTNIITRREVIKAMGAVAVLGGMSTGVAARQAEGAAAPPRRRALRIAHLTDVHVQPERKAGEGMIACLHHAQKLDVKADLILTGGDSIMDSFEANDARTKLQWDLWHATMKNECAIPVRSCIGNHDIWGWNKSRSKTTGEESNYGKKRAVEMLNLEDRYYSFDAAAAPGSGGRNQQRHEGAEARRHEGAEAGANEEVQALGRTAPSAAPSPQSSSGGGDWHIIVLDSTQPDPNDENGYKAFLDEAQFDFLQRDLTATDPATPILVLSHIPIMSASAILWSRKDTRGDFVTSGSLIHQDGVKIKDLFARHPNVKVCVSGHLHHVDRVDYNGVTYLCNGAVSGNWWKGRHKDCDEGYAVLDLYDDGSFERRYVTYGWTAAK